MYRSDHKTTTLPRSLRDELGVVADNPNSSQRKRTIPGIRKERRKVARVEKKAHRTQKRAVPLEKYDGASTTGHGPVAQGNKLYKPIDTLPSQKRLQDVPPKSILKPHTPRHVSQFDGHDNVSKPSLPLIEKAISRGVKDKLAADDAEIAALEKALGLKDKKKLPKSFEEDGLDVLLDGLGDGLDDDVVHSKRNRNEGDEWLENKRKKARKADRGSVSSGPSAMSDSDGMGSSFDGLSDPDVDVKYKDVDSNDGNSIADPTSDNNSSSPESDDFSSSLVSRKKSIRENPYVAPVTAAVAAPRYVPPSLREQMSSETEDLSRLRRQIQGLINRLSDANILSILGDVESLYRDNPRQHVSSTLLDLLLGLLSDPASLQDTFVILHAGFIAALYKSIGPDFGAQVVQKIDKDLRANYGGAQDDSQSGKKLTNLATLLSALYTFQVIGSKLIYDYIKMFIEDLSEGQVELLLKILRNAGPQLRQDDPSALKEIVVLVQKESGRIGERNLSVRTRFMIESINNLKNNRMKTGITASTIISEHVVRMKKTLGSLNTRNVKASEPLRIGLRDLRDSDKRGKWWLVGASYRDPADDAQDEMIPQNDASTQDFAELNLVQDTAGDLLQMARDQGMNTIVRRSIFAAIMDATDFNDAFQRLIKLDLKNAQKLEIPKVIIHCAGVEAAYNPYYALLSRRICSYDRKYKMAFRYSLWGLFKRLGEGLDDDQDQAEGDDEAVTMTSVVNIAKMFGTLVAEKGLDLDILKVLTFSYLQSKTSIFVELMIIEIILHSQKTVNGSRDESKIIETFVSVRSNIDLAKGLQYFLRKTVSKTDVAGSKVDKETVKWGCRVARKALDAVVSSGIVED
ncbi:MAG: hypothetical protein Q9186_000059 [Xanthomendoza sp. 1 TL-2023]